MKREELIEKIARLGEEAKTSGFDDESCMLAFVSMSMSHPILRRAFSESARGAYQETVNAVEHYKKIKLENPELKDEDFLALLEE